MSDLPRAIAFASARTRPLEPDRDPALPLQAWVEHAVLRLLSEDLRDLASLPFLLESAMRTSMSSRMDAEAWVELVAALEGAGRLDSLGLPEGLPGPAREAAAALGVEPELGRLVKAGLTASWAHHPPDLGAAVASLVAESPLLSGETLCWVASDREVGGAVVARVRPLVGTAWPAMEERELRRPPGPLPGLYFLSPERDPLPVPAWLARWDEATAQLRMFAGRDRDSGAWLYAARCAPAPLEELRAPEGEAPIFVGEPTWATPAPIRRTAADHVVRDAGAAHAVTVTFAPERRSSPPALPHSSSPGDGARTIARALGGRDLMRFFALEPGATVVLGRSPGPGGFGLHHHQVSRAHAQLRVGEDGRVWVRDLKSANGTTIDGKPVGETEVEVRRGHTLGVGPALVRVEGVTPEQEARLQEIGQLRDDERRRDPLTSLLVPKHLVDELPEELRATFGPGGGDLWDPAIWGVLLFVDRLSAIHAQHGEQLANEVFHNVARLIQFGVDHPGRCVRVGYGEVLVPLIGADRTGAWAVAERLLEVTRSHPWSPSAEGLTLTGAVARKSPAESAQAWLQRARGALQSGRTRHGRARVYAAEE